MSENPTDNEKLLLAAWDQFQAELPKLLKSDAAGQWVVYLGGSVVSKHASEEEAFEKGIESYPEEPFIVAQVAKTNPALVIFNQ